MSIEIPPFALKAYALLYSRHGTKEEFRQSELDWIVSESMKKKIFSLLLKRGWIVKRSHDTYACTNPAEAIKSLLQFRVPEIIQKSQKPYAFTQLSAVEIWSDFAYVQRGREKSPYFIKVLKKDLKYWKEFFNREEIPNYIGKGMAIGEYVILVPVSKLSSIKKEGIRVELKKETEKFAKSNEIYAYALEQMQSQAKAGA